MDDQTFTHHCNSHKNDFSTWIKETFNEPTLAKEIENSRTKLGMVITIARWRY